MGGDKRNMKKYNTSIGAELLFLLKQQRYEVREIIGEILTAAPSETVQNSPLHQFWESGELFARNLTRIPIGAARFDSVAKQEQRAAK